MTTLAVFGDEKDLYQASHTERTDGTRTIAIKYKSR